jgi:hypothetical protein
MTSKNEFPEKSVSVDEAISKTLSGRYGNLTRRGFLSGVSRSLLKLTGVTLAAQVLPFFPGKAQAQAYGDDCGLHGYTCGTGNCQQSSATVESWHWVQCCGYPVDPCTTAWQCRRYIDHCSNTFHSPSGCTGNMDGGTPSWCNWYSASHPHYVCTTSIATGPYYDNIESCKSGCQPYPWMTPDPDNVNNLRRCAHTAGTGDG